MLQLLVGFRISFEYDRWSCRPERCPRNLICGTLMKAVSRLRDEELYEELVLQHAEGQSHVIYSALYIRSVYFEVPCHYGLHGSYSLRELFGFIGSSQRSRAFSGGWQTVGGLWGSRSIRQYHMGPEEGCMHLCTLCTMRTRKASGMQQTLLHHPTPTISSE